MIFAVLQREKFQMYNEAHVTMGNYVALLSGLPIQKGDPSAEADLGEEIRAALEEHTVIPLTREH